MSALREHFFLKKLRKLTFAKKQPSNTQYYYCIVVVESARLTARQCLLTLTVYCRLE